MRLLLIRHGETVDNVAHNYAGVLDSALTTHGAIQTLRLGAHLASSGVQISHIYSSDLQRAFKTAEAVRLAQSSLPPNTVRLELLREQDFGFLEGKPITKGARETQRLKHCMDDGFHDMETKASMKQRMETFVTTYLAQHIYNVGENETVAIVAHGIILAYLWRTLLKRFNPDSVAAIPEVIVGDRGLEHPGSWSNTGYMDLDIKSKPVLEAIANVVEDKIEAAVAGLSVEVLSAVASSSIPDLPPTPPHPAVFVSSDLTDTPITNPIQYHDLLLVVKSINNLEHLQGLKKTRGGIGSSKHDDKQQTVDSFFKRQRTV